TGGTAGLPELTLVMYSTFQVKAAAASVPSSGSVAVPEKVIVRPATNFPLVSPEVMVTVAVGAWLGVTVKVAALLVADPAAFVTTERYCPASAASRGPRVRVAVVAPETPLPLARSFQVVPSNFCHW